MHLCWASYPLSTGSQGFHCITWMWRHDGPTDRLLAATVYTTLQEKILKNKKMVVIKNVARVSILCCVFWNRPHPSLTPFPLSRFTILWNRIVSPVNQPLFSISKRCPIIPSSDDTQISWSNYSSTTSLNGTKSNPSHRLKAQQKDTPEARSPLAWGAWTMLLLLYTAAACQRVRNRLQKPVNNPSRDVIQYLL